VLQFILDRRMMMGVIDLQQMASVLIIFALSAALAFAIWIVEFLLKKKHFEQRALERQASKADKPKKTRWRKERLRHGTSSYMSTARTTLKSDLAQPRPHTSKQAVISNPRPKVVGPQRHASKRQSMWHRFPGNRRRPRMSLTWAR